VAAISEPARRRLRQVLPAAASAGGPVDATAAVSPQALAEALRITAAEQGVAALIARVVQSESAGLLPVLPATRLPVPVTAVVLDQPETVRGDLRLCQDGEVAPDDNAGGDRHGHHQ
jgi:hypothetical protein